MKPDFLVIGAPKAATTSLCHHLGTHPEIFMSHPKEPRFFSHDEVYERGWNWYASLFEGASEAKAVGEGSTSYSMTGVWPETIPRIRKHLDDDIKVIYVVRDPLKRVESGWMQARHSAKSVALPSFCRSLRESPHFLDSSRYWTQLNAYREFVPDERIRVFFFEEFGRDAGAVLADCFRFLDVDPAFEVEEADEAQNTSVSHAADGRLLGAMRKLPFFDAAVKLVPAGLGRAVSRRLRKPFTGRPEWDEETRAWYVEQIEDEVRQLLDYCGKPADYWSMQPSG